MNLVYGEIASVAKEDGGRFGKVRVRGALKKISLELLTNVQAGDKVLLCDGVAISKVEEKNDVPGNSRKTA